MKITIIDGINDAVEEAVASNEYKAEIENFQKEIQTIKAFEKAELEKKAEAKSALLEKLGITEEDARLLLS